MKIKQIVILGFLFTAKLVNAQTDYRDGYVITLNNDTLKGKIDYRGDLTMGEICRFKTDTGEEIKYSPNDIAAYRINDSKYFVSKEFNGKKVFLEFLIEGKINIYYHRDNKGDHYFLKKEDTKIVEIPYENGIKYKDNVPYMYESTKHIGLLNYFFQDAPELKSKISKIGKPDHEKLIKLAEDYQNIVCKDSTCIIYEKKKPFMKISIEAMAGVAKFKEIDDSDIHTDIQNNKYYFMQGVMADFWIPRMNEKIYFRTGLLYSQVNNTLGKKSTFIDIPLQIGYLAPNSYRIRPSFSLDLLSPTYTFGLAVKINKRVNLGIQSWVYFTPFKIFVLIPDNFWGYSILGNLYIEL